MVKILAGFVMCPECGGFIEVSEDSHVIICCHCGTLHTLFPESNKSLYSKRIHPCNSCPDYSPKYSLKYSRRLPYGKTGAIPSYKLHLAQRKIFQTACRVMNRGLYTRALDFFALIPKFDGVNAKVQECRKHIQDNSAKTHRGNFAVFFGVMLQGLVMWLIFKILEALLS